jgi:YD repeat-containing protein
LTYDLIGNRVNSISDNITQSFTMGFNDVVSTNDYAYDLSGNLISDQNKQISLTYNHFNLPASVSDQNNEVLEYKYDGSGIKRQKIIDGNTRNYIDGIEYENGLQFVLTEEGRIRPRSNITISPNTAFVYDYFIKDHLGNVRAVLTNEVAQRLYAATMEAQNATVEEDLFYNIASTREGLPWDYPNDPTFTPNEKVSGLNKSEGKPIGHAKVLQVGEGDRVDIDTRYFFDGDPIIPSNLRPINDILIQLASIFFFTPPASIAGNSFEVKLYGNGGFTLSAQYNYMG